MRSKKRSKRSTPHANGRAPRKPGDDPGGGKFLPLAIQLRRPKNNHPQGMGFSKMLKQFFFSAAMIVVSLIVISGSRNGSTGIGAVTVLCAPSLAGPMEELKRSFSAAVDGDHRAAVEITYRGSAELLPLFQISRMGDVLVAADVFYHDAFAAKGLCDGPVLLGQQTPCLIYTDLSQEDALSILSPATADPRRASVKSSVKSSVESEDRRPALVPITTSIPKTDHAAIGRQVAAIVGPKEYQRIASNAKVTRETVSQVAADVSNQVVDVGIAWTTTAKQFANLHAVVPPGWEAYPSTVGVSVMNHGRHREAAQRFRDFLTSPTGRSVFERYGFSRPTTAGENGGQTIFTIQRAR